MRSNNGWYSNIALWYEGFIAYALFIVLCSIFFWVLCGSWVSLLGQWVGDEGNTASLPILSQESCGMSVTRPLIMLVECCCSGLAPRALPQQLGTKINIDQCV